MKKLLLVTTITAAFSVYTPVTKAADSIALRICEYVSVNDSKRLRKFLKERKLKIRTIFNSFKCNGQNLLVFAAKSNALDTGELIINKLPKEIVAENMKEVASHSAHLAAKSAARIK